MSADSWLEPGQFVGTVFGCDRIGHTTPDAEVHTSGALLARGVKVHPSELTLPTLRARAQSVSNAKLARAGARTQLSNTYNAADVR